MPQEKKNPYDKTSSKRQEAYKKRLTDSAGHRTVIDLDEDRFVKLEALREAGYGKTDAGKPPTKADVVRRSLDDAYAKLSKKVIKKPSGA